MKWTKSFLLHPWINRFNLLFLGGAFLLWMLDPLDALGVNNVGWMLLAMEVAYLTVRNILDRGNTPELNIRKMKPKNRERYFKLMETADRAIGEIENNKNTVYSMLAGSAEQVKRMLKTFLRLQLAGHRIDDVLKNQAVDYVGEIGRVEAKLTVAAAGEKPYLQRNLDVLRKRLDTQQDLAARRRTIDARLDTIEQAVGLLSEIGLGVTDPTETADQVQVILANVEDAETFMNELNEVMAPISVMDAN